MHLLSAQSAPPPDVIPRHSGAPSRTPARPGARLSALAVVDNTRPRRRALLLMPYPWQRRGVRRL